MNSNINIDPMIPVPAHIRKIVWETEDTFTLLLEPDNGGSGFHFSPGQFNMLYAFGIGESAISISSDPSKNDNIAHTIHRVGSVTSVLSQLEKGDVIGLRGPFGNGWPVEKAKGKDVSVQVIVDRCDSSWKGHIGVVTKLFSYIKLDTANTIAMICGPEIMMKFTIQELSQRGVPL